MARLAVELKLISDEFVELLRERAVNGVVISAGAPGEGTAAAPVTTPATGGA
jgi:hypothetical protein